MADFSLPTIRQSAVSREGNRPAEKVNTIGYLGPQRDNGLPGWSPVRQNAGPLGPRGSSQTILQLRSLILERFPAGSPAIVLFLGSENNPHIHSTCSLVAASVAELGQGRVLLVDSCPERRLTQSLKQLDSPGLSNCLSPGGDWQQRVIAEGAGRIDFLPAGTSHWEHWGAETRLLQIAAQVRQRYRFVFVNAGDAHQSMAKLWSSVCDGSYLLVSMKSSNAEIAESAVTELQASGARLLGCIATDFSG